MGEGQERGRGREWRGEREVQVRMVNVKCESGGMREEAVGWEVEKLVQ